MGINKRNILRKKEERKHAFDQKKIKIQEKERKRLEKNPKISTTLLTTKKAGFKILLSFFYKFPPLHKHTHNQQLQETLIITKYGVNQEFDFQFFQVFYEQNIVTRFHIAPRDVSKALNVIRVYSHSY